MAKYRAAQVCESRIGGTAQPQCITSKRRLVPRSSWLSKSQAYQIAGNKAGPRMQKQIQKTFVGSWDEMVDDMLAAIRFCTSRRQGNKAQRLPAGHLALIGD